MLCSCVFSYSYSASRYSYSKRSSISVLPIGPQVPANRFDRRSASPQFKQPSSTSTVRRGGLSTASLSTSTSKSNARHERKDHPGPRSARPTGSTVSTASGRLRRKVGMVEMIRLADKPWAPVAQGHTGAEVVRSVRVALRGRSTPFIEWRQVKFLKIEAADPPLRCNGLFVGP